MKKKGDTMIYRLTAVIVIVNTAIVAGFFIYVLSVGDRLLYSLDIETASIMFFLSILTTAVFFSMFIGKSPEAAD